MKTSEEVCRPRKEEIRYDFILLKEKLTKLGLNTKISKKSLTLEFSSQDEIEDFMALIKQ